MWHSRHVPRLKRGVHVVHSFPDASLFSVCGSCPFVAVEVCRGREDGGGDRHLRRGRERAGEGRADGEGHRFSHHQLQVMDGRVLSVCLVAHLPPCVGCVGPPSVLQSVHVLFWLFTPMFVSTEGTRSCAYTTAAGDHIPRAPLLWYVLGMTVGFDLLIWLGSVVARKKQGSAWAGWLSELVCRVGDFTCRRCRRSRRQDGRTGRTASLALSLYLSLWGRRKIDLGV